MGRAPACSFDLAGKIPNRQRCQFGVRRTRRGCRALRQQPRNARQRKPPEAAARPFAPQNQASQRTGSQQITSRLVQRLHGKRIRRSLCITGVCDAGTHLHQAVEPPTPSPRPRPTPRIEADVHQAGAQPFPILRAETQRLQRARPIAVDQHVGLGQQLGKPSPVLRLLQIQPGAIFAHRHLGDHARLRPCRRIEPQHGGPVRSQEPGRDRPRQHPRQVQHPHSRKRPPPIQGIGQRGSLRRTHFASDQRLGCDGKALWMKAPSLRSMKRRRTRGCLHQRLFQRRGVPIVNTTGHRLMGRIFG